MIAVVYGVPGSGKTYYAVWWIRKRCLEEGDVFMRVRSDVLLITNLKLNLDSSEGYVYLEDFQDFAKYMDVDFWRANLQYMQGKKVVFVIDECQLFFYHYKDDPKVLFFLQYHRHLGVDILLITQTPKSLPAKVFELSEFLVEAVPKSVNPFGFRAFRYRVLHPFDRDLVLRRFHLAFDPVVFYLYSDMIYKPPEEGEKVGNAFMRYYVLLGAVLVVFLFLVHLLFSHISSLSQPMVRDGGSSSQRAVQVQPVIDYEDLITEEREEKASGGVVSSSPVDEGGVGSSPAVSVGSWNIVVESSGRSYRSGDEVILVSEPKVIILP